MDKVHKFTLEANILLAIAFTFIGVCNETANAKKPDNAKIEMYAGAIKQELGRTAGAWMKLQQAYVMEIGDVGDNLQISYTFPGCNKPCNNSKTEYLKFESNLQNGTAYWIATTSIDLKECKAGNKWVVYMDKNSDDAKIELPDEPCRRLTPNFGQMGNVVNP